MRFYPYSSTLKLPHFRYKLNVKTVDMTGFPYVMHLTRDCVRVIVVDTRRTGVVPYIPSVTL